MKKWLIAITAIVLLLLGSVYFFIPNYISLRQTIPIKANKQGLMRVLVNYKSWSGWWPGKQTAQDTTHSEPYMYGDNAYTLRDKTFTSFFINVSGNGFKAVTDLNLVAIKLDSTNLEWEAKIPTSYNPFKRLKIYLSARKFSQDMKSILEKMRSFFSTTENVYGYNIRKALVVDSTLISTFTTSKNYPSTDIIYGLIDQLKNYITLHEAKETGFPMLNITSTDSVGFITRVAIPVNKKLPSSGNIAYKWMLGGGNILITEIKGGSSAINTAFKQIENYTNDYQRVAPAIPFLSLVTDRRKEPDSTKWVTRIYYPVI
jgi:hypothetical protein